TAVVLENVARAYGVDEAHQALMNSPGHRANLMSTLATHIGIGVTYGDGASGRREMFITQVFTRVPPPFNLTQAAATVRQKLATARPLPVVDALDRLAQQLAEGLAPGKTPEAAHQWIGGAPGGAGDAHPDRAGRSAAGV